MPLKWSDLFATRITFVDEQHCKLFDMFNALADDLEAGTTSDEKLDKAFDELMEYAYNHFVEEERMMAQNHLDHRALSLQRMEHKSFLYDVERMRQYMVSDARHAQGFEDLLQFISSWLIYHTLRSDLYMAFQVERIKAGSSPEEAFEESKRHILDAAIYNEIVEALLHLWQDAAARLAALEESDPEEVGDARA